METSRRHFLKMGVLTGSSLLMPVASLNAGDIKKSALFLSAAASHHGEKMYEGNELLTQSFELLKSWGEGLLSLQITDPQLKGLYGGLLCPACSCVHGRCGDAILSFLSLAKNTGDKRYVSAALRLYKWMEDNVSMADGSWVNEVSVSDWKGITVFGAIVLAESLINFSDLLDATTILTWKKRLEKAANYLYKEFTIDTGNINYPITCTYALCLIGDYLGKPEFTTKGKMLARDVMRYFSVNDHLIFGEGKPAKEVSRKGCYAIDLGYNVEESLPALVLYTKLTGDALMKKMLIRSLSAHAEFMLPDGGWDNSWGTRNFKWTYWGSRTSDGCQTAYALMSDENPAFHNVALQNLLLLKSCSTNNLLYGGLHNIQHGILPCMQHTLGHSKALAILLLHINKNMAPNSKSLMPRAYEYGVKAFRDINTWLISKGDWRATITGYDQEYSVKSGHATGGAMTMLWHKKTGLLLTGSMTSYQLVESFNMQRDKDPFSIALTPRFEVVSNGITYTNINDLNAIIKCIKTPSQISLAADAWLTDEDQNKPLKGNAACQFEYIFTAEQLIIRASCKFKAASNGTPLKYVLPLVSTADEEITKISDKKFVIHKKAAKVILEASSPINILESTDKRVFNFVPGVQAIPFFFQTEQLELKISILV